MYPKVVSRLVVGIPKPVPTLRGVACVSTGAWARGFWTLARTETRERVKIVSVPRPDFGVFCFVLCAVRRARAPTGQRGPAIVSPLSSRPVDVKIVRFDPVTS
jgi:hypothetical protein